MSDQRKQSILDALQAFIRQRAGLEFGNYYSGNHAESVRNFRQEQRAITRDRHQAETLLGAVRWRDSITADMLIDAAKHAYSGRLTITERSSSCFAIEYCTGQYFPTEYRRAVCAVLAEALWYYTREHCMPSKIVRDGEEFYPHVNGSKNVVSAGTWLRDHMRREFGRTIQERWFS